MPVKNKEPHRFTIGDKAKVRNIHTGQIIDEGEIIHVEQLHVRFKSELQKFNFGTFAFRREGNKWIERRRNQFELI